MNVKAKWNLKNHNLPIAIFSYICKCPNIIPIHWYYILFFSLTYNIISSELKVVHRVFFSQSLWSHWNIFIVFQYIFNYTYIYVYRNICFLLFFFHLFNGFSLNLYVFSLLAPHERGIFVYITYIYVCIYFSDT